MSRKNPCINVGGFGSEELDIDLKDIFYKIRCVLLPFRIDREILLSSPDFWGPMLVICAYSMLLVWGQVGPANYSIFSVKRKKLKRDFQPNSSVLLVGFLPCGCVGHLLFSC